DSCCWKDFQAVAFRRFEEVKMVQPEQIKQWIEAALLDSSVEVEGEDGHHFHAVVVCSRFRNKNTLQRHRMVYDALGDKMQSAIHALSIKTYTPEEVNS